MARTKNRIDAELKLASDVLALLTESIQIDPRDEARPLRVFEIVSQRLQVKATHVVVNWPLAGTKHDG